jgi:transposase-like protein
VPFLAFPPEVRRVISTTNLIESMNSRLRTVTRNRGQFPSGQPALKVLYLAVRNLNEFRGQTTGIRSSSWKQALQPFTIYFDGRIPTPGKPPRSLTQTDDRTLPGTPHSA